jgi:hypothetical protein
VDLCGLGYDFEMVGGGGGVVGCRTNSDETSGCISGRFVDS